MPLSLARVEKCGVCGYHIDTKPATIPACFQKIKEPLWLHPHRLRLHWQQPADKRVQRQDRTQRGQGLRACKPNESLRMISNKSNKLILLRMTSEAEDFFLAIVLEKLCQVSIVVSLEKYQSGWFHAMRNRMKIVGAKRLQNVSKRSCRSCSPRPKLAFSCRRRWVPRSLPLASNSGAVFSKSDTS